MTGYRDVLDEASAACLALGIRILQGHRLGPTDEAHVSELLYRLNPPHGAKILDVGCGFGEVARLMGRERRDLRFVLLNENAGQLAHAPPRFPRIRADLHAIPLADASVDVVMFLYVLCHSDLDCALAEAARVTRPGGELFVYDYARTAGNNTLMRKRLYARAPRWHEWVNAMHATGWQVYDFEAPGGSDAVFRRAYGNDAEYDRIFAELVPMIWRARRSPNASADETRV